MNDKRYPKSVNIKNRKLKAHNLYSNQEQQIHTQ